MEYRKTGIWRGQRIPADLSDDAHQANVAIMILTPRVRDDRIREMTKSSRSYVGSVVMSQTREAAMEALEKMINALEPLHERIGEVLRKMDDDEDAEQLDAAEQ
jgi:hypothetical protein